MYRLGHSIDQLEDLDVSYNNIEKIAYDIGEMASLTNFNLYSNNLTVLPTTIGNLPKLMTLNLGVNQLEELPEEMRMLVTLHGILDLSDNKFNQRPNFVWHLKGLKHVIMSEIHKSCLQVLQYIWYAPILHLAMVTTKRQSCTILSIGCRSKKY